MKKAVYISLLLCSSLGLFSQVQNGEEIPPPPPLTNENWTKAQAGDKNAPVVYTMTEQMPEFPGGMAAMMKYLQENLNYPSNESKHKLGGKVFVKFIVDTTGKPQSVEAIKGSGFTELDREAIRVVKAMPAWNPGIQDGKKVPVYFNLPINYQISGPQFVFNTGNKDETYTKSRDLMYASDYKGLIKAMETILEKNPGDKDALYTLAMSYFMTDNRKKGCSYLKQAVEKNHSTAEKKITELCN